MNKEPDKTTNLVKVDVIAQMFGLTARRINQLTQDGILPTTPTTERGGPKGRRYDLIPTVKKYIEYLRNYYEKKSEEGKLTPLEQAELDFKIAKARIQELKLAELEGRMHAAEDVEAMTTDLVLMMRGSLLAMPGRLAVDLSELKTASEISARVDLEVKEILKDLVWYRYDPEKYAKRVRDREGWLGDGGEDDESEE